MLSKILILNPQKRIILRLVTLYGKINLNLANKYREYCAKNLKI